MYPHLYDCAAAEYLAHEVRNPLAASLTACSFLETGLDKLELSDAGVRDPNDLVQMKEDVNVVKSSLDFINDLLRSLLDLGKIENRQMSLNTSPTDLLNDVMEPVATIVRRRHEALEIKVDCPENVVVETDRMRLKQVVLNLAQNSKKFLEQGFIRLRVQVLPGEGGVEISVSDSGPGIPKSKQSNLFARFQESLDLMQQGTGIGLVSVTRHCVYLTLQHISPFVLPPRSPPVSLLSTR